MKKQMPKTPKELREEWEKLTASEDDTDVSKAYDRFVANYWLSIIASRDAELLAWIEGKMGKKEHGYPLGYKVGYEEALMDTQAYLQANTKRE